MVTGRAEQTRGATGATGFGERRARGRSAVAPLVLALAGFTLLVGLAKLVGPEAFQAMTRDPLAVARSGDDITPVTLGWLSHLGVLVWTMASGAAVLAVVSSRAAASERAMLLGAAALSLGLALDDLLQLHESVVPRLTRFTEEHVMLGWALLAAVWVVACRRSLLNSPHVPVLAVGVAFLAWSVGTDVVDDLPIARNLAAALGGQAVLEDGAKLIGIICWASFMWLQSRWLLDRTAAVTSEVGPPHAGTPR